MSLPVRHLQKRDRRRLPKAYQTAAAELPEALVYELEEVPSLDGLTYEATWENAQKGICIYLYEEGSAVLEISPAWQLSGRNETQTAGEDAESEESSSDLRFLLLPEQTQSLAIDSLLESWQQDPDSVQTKTSSD